jgi:cyclic pyranopterin phosphate synthase
MAQQQREMVVDQRGRAMGDLRISVTDRCNLRCRYCMPEEHYNWLPRDKILNFEEIDRLVGIFAGLGTDKVRLTGGEPLHRRDLHVLVRMIAKRPAIRDLAMTTNGVLLGDQLGLLKAAGLRRLTVSLDTLKPGRFRALTRRDGHERVIEAIRAVAQAGFVDTKLDTVVIRGVNDDEIADLIEFGKAIPAEVRFIEYMDVGGATQWSMDKVMSRAQMLEVLAARYGRVEPIPRGGDTAPAARFRLGDGTTFGIISSTTQPFCSSCNRSRLTADGTWYLCLYALKGVDLRGPLRRGASAEELTALVRGTWRGRNDRGAEARLAGRERGPLISLNRLRLDPRLEMHTRGG